MSTVDRRRNPLLSLARPFVDLALVNAETLQELMARQSQLSSDLLETSVTSLQDFAEARDLREALKIQGNCGATMTKQVARAQEQNLRTLGRSLGKIGSATPVDGDEADDGSEPAPAETPSE